MVKIELSLVKKLQKQTLNFSLLQSSSVSELYGNPV